MKQILWTGGLIVALSGAAAPALAHHSLQSEYDINQSITLKGTVTKVDWVNPHVYVYLDVKDDKGAVTKWAVTTLPPGNLRRGGLTRDLLGFGEPVSIEVPPAEKTVPFSEAADAMREFLGGGLSNGATGST